MTFRRGRNAALLTSVAVVALLVQARQGGAASSSLVTFFGEDLNPAGSGTLSSHPNSDTARTSFFSNLQGVGTETFESIPAGTTNPTISFPGAGTATLNGLGSVQSGPSGSDQYPISGTNYYNAGTGTFSITFSGPIAAFGFYGTDIGDFGGQVTLTLGEVGGGTTVITVPNSIDPSQTDGSALYFGFYDKSVQYTSITFGNVVSGGGASGDVFGFDDFSVGTLSQVVPNAVINTTDGDIARNVFSLGSAAARANPVEFDGGTLRMIGGQFANNIITAPVTIDRTGGTVDTSTGNGGFSGVVSGPGGLTVTGGGTFALLNANTYQGGTTLQSGTLVVGNDTALGTGRLSMADGTTLAEQVGVTIGNATTIAGRATFQTSDTTGAEDGLIDNGVISGTGTLVKTGASGLRLVAANTYSGGTIIEGGHIGVANDDALGTGTVTFAGGDLRAHVSGLTIRNAAVLASDATIGTKDRELAYAGDISGPGSLTKTGSGLLILSGQNGFGGATIVAEGTLRAGSAGGFSTASAVTIADSAAVLDLGGFMNTVAALNGTGTVTTSGAAATLTIGGSADGAYGGTLRDGAAGLALVKEGTGTQALNGASTFTGGTAVHAGTLLLGNSAALGSGGLTLDDGTTLGFTAGGLDIANAIALPAVDPTIDTGSMNETISGVISGPGALTKLGSGTLDLTGTNTYTGATDVVGGTLLVDGSTNGSAITVENGASLGGTGSVGAFTAKSGAVIVPSAGKSLSVVGTATFLTGSTYQVTVNGDGTNAKLTANKATLGGATLSILPGTGTFGAATYTLLSTAAGVSGTFGTVTTGGTLSLFDPVVSYTADDVVLTLHPVAFTTLAQTPNQAAAAAAIQALGPTSPLYQAVLQLNAGTAPGAFSASAGITHASNAGIVGTTARLGSSLILDRLWDLGGSGLSARQVLDQFAPDGGLPALVQCYGPVPDPVPAAPARSYTAWGEGFGSFGHTDGGANAGGLDRSLGGFVLGIDTPVDHVLNSTWRVGVAGGYTNTTFQSAIDGGSGTVQGVFGSLYGGARYGAIDVRAGVTGGGTFTDARRTVSFPGFLETETSSSNGYTVQGFGEVGYRFTMARAVFEPVAGASVLHIHTDAFQEKGGAAALAIAGFDQDVGTTTLGARGEYSPFKDVPLVAHGYLAWQHVIGNVAPASVVAFEAAPAQTFSISGAPIDRDALAAEAALDYRASAALDIGLSYTGLVGAVAADHSVKGRMEYRF